MSLLLNALKKAALDKQKREQTFSDGDLSQVLSEDKHNSEEKPASPQFEAEEQGINTPQTDKPYMDFDPEFMDVKAVGKENQKSESRKSGNLFIENDESSWDDNLNKQEFNLEDIDPDLEFDAEEFEEREATVEQVTDNSNEPMLANEAEDLNLSFGEEASIAVEESTPVDIEASLGPLDLENQQATNHQTEENNEANGELNQRELDVADQVTSNESTNKNLTIEESDTNEKSLQQSSLDTTQNTEPKASIEVKAKDQVEVVRQQTVKQLLQHSETAVENSKRKRTAMLAFLATLVSCVTGGFYYYIATSEDTSNLVLTQQVNPLRPLVVNEFEAEGWDNLAAALEVELTSLTALPANSTDEAQQSNAVAKQKAPSTKVPQEKTKQSKLVTTRNTEKSSQEQSVGNIAQAKKKSPQEQRVTVSKNNNGRSPFRKAISEGFAAWQSGEWKIAESAYNEALAIDPNHRDAILGAAAIAAQLGHHQKALQLYQKRIERAPRDEFALAGILGLGSSNSVDANMESELNVLLQSFPQAAHLHFLKGTVHAQRKQWQAAQSAFFEAWRLDYSRPDYVFNLAVAMDHLELHPQALKFYFRAEELSAKHASNFSLPELRARIAQLKYQLAQGI